MVKTWFGLGTRMTCSDHDRGHAVQKPKENKSFVVFRWEMRNKQLFLVLKAGVLSIHPPRPCPYMDLALSLQSLQPIEAFVT